MKDKTIEALVEKGEALLELDPDADSDINRQIYF